MNFLKWLFEWIVKIFAWLVVALGLWVPILYCLIFVIVCAITQTPLSNVTTFFWVGLMLSLLCSVIIIVSRPIKFMKKTLEKSNNSNLKPVRKKDDSNAPVDYTPEPLPKNTSKNVKKSESRGYYSENSNLEQAPQDASNGQAPQGQQFSPQGQQYSPQNQQFSPQNQQFSPQNQQYPPQGQQYSPQNQQFSPQGQQFSPQNQQYPPQGQQFSPQGQQFSPQEQQYSPRGQSDGAVARQPDFWGNFAPEPEALSDEPFFEGEQPLIFKTRKDPNLLIYEFANRIEVYRRTAFGMEKINTEWK